MLSRVASTTARRALGGVGVSPWRVGARTAYAGLIPMVVDSTPRGERAFDIFSRLLQERIVCLNGPIHDDLSAVVVAQLLYLESQSTERPISLYINSPGGVVTAGLAIYDTMQFIQPPVATLCVERTGAGIRYVTEKCQMVFSGPLRRLVSGLAGIGVEACTELSARDGKLEATGDFALTLPLPRWWPVPDRAMVRGEGMIRGIVEKDTRLTVERLISSVS